MDFANRIGHDNFVWWMGVVEDRADPLNLGRCRVRIFGSHSPDKNLVPTDSLPWSQPMIPVNGSLTTGTAQEGDYVFGFFFDGLSSQAPCIMGVLPGIPQEYVNNSKGFTDARTPAELSASPRKPVINVAFWSEGTASLNPSILGEPTTSRVSRDEKINETLIGYRKATRDLLVPTAGASVWSEPVTEYAPKAPYNRVTETESGHLMEFDDTPGAERVNITHRTGSFVEFHPDGSKVTKVIGKNYEIILKDDNVHIKGSYNLTVNGNANILVEQNATIVAGISASVTAGVSASVTAGADITATAGGVVAVTSPLVEITAATTNINGALNVTGLIKSDTDVVTDYGVSLNQHVHSGVKAGPDFTGYPVP